MQWLNATLEYTQICDPSTNRNYTAVSSPYLYVITLSDGCQFIPNKCGVHYCTLLSPATVLEWLYTDSLRFYLSLSSSNSTVNMNCNI